MGNIVDIKVWGDYACFTRPEFKVERVSYPVITPSAARGVLEAIYWKPQIRYRVQRIGILEIGTQWSLLRNEISKRQSDSGGHLIVEDERQQRTVFRGGLSHATERQISANTLIASAAGPRVGSISISPFWGAANSPPISNGWETNLKTTKPYSRTRT